MKSKLTKRMISVLLAVVLSLSGIIPAMTAFAGDGVEGHYDLQIFFSDTDTMVPTYEDDGTTAYKYHIKEGETLQLTYKLIDSAWPDNGKIKWYSEAPELVDVDQTGKVKGFDSSKGAVIKAWINNEVRPIPIVGKLMATVIEKALFNDKVNVDTMDTEEIVDLVIKALGSDSILADYIEAYSGQLVDSLRDYLDRINSVVHCVLYDGNGEQVADDSVQFVVEKNEEWYANFLPNGTHITNKSQIAETQAVGNTVQLYALTTPQRLQFGTQYSVKSTSIFSTGKVVATVTDGGLVTFKNKGTVTIMASPDSEQVINNILKLVNYFYKLENTGTLNTDKIAKILIEYMGLDINRAVLAGILDACFAIYKVVGDTADPVQLTATAVEILSNLILQMVYNDSITFTVVDSTPIDSFDIDGVLSVKEGAQTQLQITNVQPSTGNMSDIEWSSSDPSVASVDPKTGVITGLDAGGALGSLSTKEVTITAISTTNKVERHVTVTVTGKTGKFLSGAKINGDSSVPIGGEADYTYTVYPQRVAESKNLYITWGILTGEDEDGNPTYVWATDEEPAKDNVGQIDSKGHYTAIGGGTSTLALMAKTGYYLSNGEFYEISSKTATLDVMTGIPIDNIDIEVTGAASGGTVNKSKEVEINGQKYQYVTIHKGVGEAYINTGAQITATIEPATATDQNLTWVVDNSDYNVEQSDDTHLLTVKRKAGKETADTFNVYAKSSDGRKVSNTVTVCVTRNYATDNKIDQESITLLNGETADATHTMTFNGSWTGSAYACYGANWYSSDEDVFTVESKGNDNSDAVIKANDVGTATLYCVSADGGIVDSCTVTVKPDKRMLKQIIDLCDKTIVLQTKENKPDYKKYMRKLDLAYSIYYEQDMASQTTVDTYSDALLQAFIKVGGFVGISRVNILGTNKSNLDSKRVTVKVGTAKDYRKYSYDLDFSVNPTSSMYSKVEWSSSNDSISVDKDGICRPTKNDACTANITCTVTDYSGTKVSDTVAVSFVKTSATGVTLDQTAIEEAKIGESVTLKATVAPTNVFGNSTASVQDVTWYSTNTKVASVDSKGVVTFNYGGDCTIVCTTVDGGYTAECAVHVVTNYDNLALLITQLNDLNLNENSYYPETWEPYVQAKKDAENMLETKGYTQAQVDEMYNTLDEAYKGLKRYVYIQKVELYLDGEPTSDFYQCDLSVFTNGLSYKNASIDLKVRLYPNNASYASVKWESSTTDISVSSDGKCSPTANKSCYGRITCTVTDHFGNEFSDDVWVSFAYKPVTGIKLSQSAVSGNKGDTYQMEKPVIEPVGTKIGTTYVGGASIQDYYWESADENVATIDENGLITFVSAGSTVIRCISYDGGITAECRVSTEGDRTALKAALEKYADVDYTNYEYSYAMACNDAYAAAQEALTDVTMSQEAIDKAASDLTEAGEAMEAHPNIAVDSLLMSYETYKKPLVGSASKVSDGNIGINDALSVNLGSSDYSNYNDYNYVNLTVSTQPADAMYKSLVWTVDDSYKINTKISDSTITLTPKDKDNGAWAKVTATATDYFGRVTARTAYIVLSDNVCTGMTVSTESVTLNATDSPYQISPTLSGSPEFTTVLYSSSNESVAAVDANGAVTPKEKGETVITAKTLDGGYTKKITVKVLADFSELAKKVGDYTELINNSKGNYVYTDESLDALTQEVAAAKAMVDENKATQAQVNAQLAKLVEAYNNLQAYTPATGVKIDLNTDDSENAEVVNDGYIRYTGVALNGKSVKLKAVAVPENSRYATATWSSDNENITVSSDGLVTNSTASPGVAKITCTVKTVYDAEYTSYAYVSFVRSGVTKVTFDDEMIYGAPLETKKLSPNFISGTDRTEINASLSDCTYSSSAENIASVDSDGNVTFHTQGTAIITVTALDGGIVGTIEAYTTWDTSALKSALDQADTIEYTDYAYDYGTAFKTVYDEAKTVYANIKATQQEIDDACTKLQEAMTNLEGHPFVAAKVELKHGDTALDSGTIYQVDDNGQFAVSYDVNSDAMYKSIELSSKDENGVTSEVSGNTITFTKTADGTAYATVVATVTDTYDRVTTVSATLKLVNAIVNITSIKLTADGTELDRTLVKSGYGRLYTTFEDIQLGYILNPTDATDPVSVTWNSSAPNYITVSDEGVLSLTKAAILKATNTSNITCTVTNSDGSKVSASVQVTISR